MPVSRALKFNTGFTLVEMMVSVLLIGTVLSLIAPLGSVVEAFRLDYINQRVYSSSAIARGESIKRGVQVSLCRSVSGAACDVTDNNWAAGWVMFVNPNNDDVIDAGEEIIRVYSALNSSLRLTWDNGNILTFVPRGSPAAFGRFTLCVAGVLQSPTRTVSISGTGQIRKATLTEDCI